MHGHPDGLCVREGSEKREMMDLELWKQRREELMHEAKQNRLARALRDSRKRRGAGLASSLAWELRRHAGHLRKFVRSLRKTDSEGKEMSGE
jgi:hypothetical protein